MSTTPTSLAAQAAPMDALLVDAALGRRPFTPDLSTARWAVRLAGQPVSTVRRLAGLGGELGRIAVGASEVTPNRRDRRFADPAWSSNPLLRRVVQAYLAGSATADQLIADAGLDERDAERVRFLVQNVAEAVAPSNVPLVNPASAKAAIDSAGLSMVRGAGQLVKDLAHAPRVPEMVDTTPFAVGGNVAVTPGAVVARTELFELIQYTPQTEEVFEVPLLLVPPTINKYYAIDLAPERSLVEHSVRQGRQVFVISWRNPEARHADWDFDTYVSGILEALDAVRDGHRDGADRSRRHLLGRRPGIDHGRLPGREGQLDRIAALLLAVTVLDTEGAGTTAALASPQLLAAAKESSRRKGYLDGAALAEVFAWLRPGDLVWNYWVNNYLLGKRPPAFDILFWNSDTTRMTAGLHADFIDQAVGNSLTRPHALTVLGQSIDLGAVDVDAYVVAGVADHITPWQSCYRTTQLLGGSTRFVLSTSGHIAALVNPPGNPKASYRTNTDTPADATAWLDSAQTEQGTWWTDVSVWLDERSGDRKPAPTRLGSDDLPPLVAAPGTYVLAS